MFTKMDKGRDNKQNIHFWIFGPEYGCLTRQIPIIEKFLQTNRYKITLFIHKNHNDYVRAIFNNKVKIKNYGFSLKLIYKKNFDINIPITFLNLLTFSMFGSIKQFLIFKKSLKENPIIVTDFLPQIIFFAKILKRNIIGVYNYSLDYINLGKDPLAKILSYHMSKIYNLAYNLCTIMIIERISPKENFNNKVFVSPIARKISINKNNIRNELNIKDDERLIFLSIGGNSNPKYVLEKFHKIVKKTNLKILILPRNDFELKIFKEKYNLFIYPQKTVYKTQNYICSCDLIISKAGFGTVSECLKNNCKILPIHLERHAEIRETEINLKKNNLIIDLIYDTDSEQEIVDKIGRTLNNNKILENIENFKCDGENEIFEILAQKLKII